MEINGIEQSEPIMRKDITYISGVQMEEAVEIIRHCTFRDEEMELTERTIRNIVDFQNVYMELIKFWNFERCLSELHANTGRETFYYYGRCAVCNSPQPLIVDYQAAEVVDGQKKINWRERLICPNCHCNSRQRFMAHKIFENYKSGKQILMYENNSNIFRLVKREIPSLRGFEYAGVGYTGDVNGVYCEDICNLSFKDEEFDLLVSNDIFEHVYDYQGAFDEAYRVLKPGGKLVFTVPFDGNNNVTDKRAEVSEGVIIYTKDKFFHENPVQGIDALLVFQVFGWDILESLKLSGFQDAYGKVYYGLKEGYMGYLPMYFEAYK